MALVICPECGKDDVSSSAIACPNCGYNVKRYYDKLKRRHRRIYLNIPLFEPDELREHKVNFRTGRIITNRILFCR